VAVVVGGGGGGGVDVDVEEVEDLRGFHCGEAGVLLVDDSGGDVDFEALEAVVRVLGVGVLMSKRKKGK